MLDQHAGAWIEASLSSVSLRIGQLTALWPWLPSLGDTCALPEAQHAPSRFRISLGLLRAL